MSDNRYYAIPIFESTIVVPYLYYVFNISKETFFTFSDGLDAVTGLFAFKACTWRGSFAYESMIVINIRARDWYFVFNAASKAVTVVGGAFITPSFQNIRKEF